MKLFFNLDKNYAIHVFHQVKLSNNTDNLIMMMLTIVMKMSMIHFSHSI